MSRLSITRSLSMSVPASLAKIWNKVGLGMTCEVPFPDASGGVASSAEDFCNRDLVLVQHRVKVLQIVTLSDTHRVAAGHQGATRRTADRLGVVM
ncbi:MAG: hypothetical protein ACI9NC_005335 [Verrucomicrobiales bacterium]|jgi:hypothetical protein